ncbi:MAG: class I SAM-dependent methyltransferase [Dysgonamonadaceae bacterium]|jgi:predicted O-methyltransferase YrrM|nr:class I SAM-dependent methyltransferase [Dysgonamonadaceae bacterium]
MKNLIIKIIKKCIEFALRNNNEFVARNITLELQRRALSSTVDYIQKNMSKVDSVNSSLELLNISLDEVDITKNGLILEFGVFSGKTINHIASRVQQTVYGFDSFEGLPERWRDGFSTGHFQVTHLPKVRQNVILIKGWFDQTLPSFLAEHVEPISFLHIDCDLYSSTKTVFELCANRIHSGTVIVFDEYFNYDGWEDGEYKAFQEFVVANNIRYQYLGYNRFHEQVAVVIL